MHADNHLRVRAHQYQYLLQGHDLEYFLPHGDKLRLIGNPDKKTARLLLLTHNPELIKCLPGPRPSSLVADVINKIHHYRIRSSSYKQPLSSPQKEKLELANQVISSLTSLLKLERALSISDYEGQEELRLQVLTLIDTARNSNRLIADDPVTSEGQLGIILANAYKTAQNYYFNRIYPTSYEDQLDFNPLKLKPDSWIVWDSEVHLGYDKEALHNTLRVLCEYYQLSPINELNNLPANRFLRMLVFMQGLWNDGKKWFASGGKQNLKPEMPLYTIEQKGYSDLKNLVACVMDNPPTPLHAATINEAQILLNTFSTQNHWAIVTNENKIVLRINNRLQELSYFIQDKHYFPSPTGQDLYDQSQCRQHLPWTKRFPIQLKEFFFSIPRWFNSIYQSLKHFIIYELREDFLTHVHNDHLSPAEQLRSKQSSLLEETLKKAGFLNDGQTIEAFIKEQLHKSPYIIARATHPPSPALYTNPFHRIVNVVRHLAGFFIETTQRNPSIGLLAMAAYVYGAGAVLAPSKLATLLTKLHLKGLIAGIEPTQKLAHFMSHGKTSEAISASATFWQGTIAGGNLDKFFINAIDALKNDPAEIAILACLALSMGYGITKIVPSLGREMGEFPYTTYAALGGKTGAALYDVLMHPGDDWLLGTCKWLSQHLLTLTKISIAPFIEAYHYGYKHGFINGWKKSYLLLKNSIKQLLAGSLDLALTLLTIPLIEGSALFIHVPFRGFTNLIRTLLSYMSSIGDTGATFLHLGPVFKACNYGFTISCNWLEMQSTSIKQRILSILHIQRIQLYVWAFQQENKEQHLLSMEEKKEQEVPGDEISPYPYNSHLLNKVLKSTIVTSNEEKAEFHYSPIFSSFNREKNRENEVNLQINAKI